MNTLRPGYLLDNRYLIVRTLAAGGFGQTYIAEDTRRPGNPVCVVKHLTPASSDPQFLENATRLFLTEAQTLERLGKHDHIPRLLAYFEENQQFYLVQDWIDGYPLTNELLPGQRWSESKVCQMLQEVLSILQFVHSFGVIHRDIKPDNLIRRRQDGKLALVDFGIVKQIRTQILTPGQMNANATIAVGTPGYMPTEQGRGNPRPNSDIYALGIIGIQAVTGLNPTQFQEDNETGEIIWQPWASISEELGIIISKMVLYHFRNRYQSTTEALQALEPLLVRFSPLPNSLVISSRQAPVVTPQPTQVSSPPVEIPINEAQFTQVSLPPVEIPINEAQFTQVSLPLVEVPINEAQFTQVSLPLVEVPINEAQFTQVSLPLVEIPISEAQFTQVSLPLVEIPISEAQFTQVSSPPEAVPISESQFTQISSLPEAVPISESQFTQISSLPEAVPISESQFTQISSPPVEVPTNEARPDTGKAPRFEQKQDVLPFPDSSAFKQDIQLNYIQLLRQAAIIGTGNWIMAIFLISIIGTVWISATFWLIILGFLIFRYFAKSSPLLHKYAVFGIAVLSSAITFLFLPHGIISGSPLQSGQAVILVIFLLAIFAGALAFILIILSEIFVIYE